MGLELLLPAASSTCMVGHLLLPSHLTFCFEFPKLAVSKGAILGHDKRSNISERQMHHGRGPD